MAGEFPVIPVHPEEVIGDEALGSKPKFWIRRNAEEWLFKEAREGTGEDWAEKIAAELAILIGIRAARVELAEFQGRRGCICRSFVDTASGEALIHGNDILAGTVVGYDRKKRFGQSNHTLENIYRAIRRLFPGKDQYGTILHERMRNDHNCQREFE